MSRQKISGTLVAMPGIMLEKGSAPSPKTGELLNLASAN